MTGGDEHLAHRSTATTIAYNLDSIGNWLNYSWTTDQTNFGTSCSG